MTNGNSAERERFEKWIGQKRPDESGMEQYSWDDCWSAWEARAAMSVCADDGKGEAVYQFKSLLGWDDCTEEEYKAFTGFRKRILYTAPQAECAPRETQPEKNHIDTMVHNAKIIQALHVARYALVTHSGCRVICEGVSRTMDFEPELDQVDEVMTMLGVDLTEPLPAPVAWDSKDDDDE